MLVFTNPRNNEAGDVIQRTVALLFLCSQLGFSQEYSLLAPYHHDGKNLQQEVPEDTRLSIKENGANRYKDTPMC
jgi:hypothetical protein